MTTATAADARHMARALELARRGLYTTDPNPRVGCVIVSSDGHVVGEGWHERAGQAHAEVMALQQAGERAKGACAYVTLEPCSHYGRTPPCADALIAAGIASVVCAMQDPNPQVSGRGLDALRAAGIAVDLGLMAAQAQALNCGFVSRMQGQGPYVRLKMAQSLDGRNAMASGESQWITGAAARADVHRLRARSSAIITGIGSVLNDNPRMTARVPDGEVKQPLRVILDTQLRLAPDAKILDEAGTIVYCDAAAEMGALAGPLRQRGAEIRAIAVDDEGRPDLSTLLTDLANRDHCNEILVEAGATVAGAMLRRKLVHELWLYMAPSLMGSSARPAFQLALQFMHEKQQWRYQDLRMFDKDLRIRLTPLN